ncbi:MAG TPA: glycosyl hydrolase [Propionibacteriaceae bacterium]|nr:glycosyl hydrolase [Propionibacteriaceae bacterium]
MIIATAMIMVTAAACNPAPTGTNGDDQVRKSSSTDVFTESQVKPLVSDIVHKTVKPLPTKRLADGLVPPTNQWFSGLVFGDEPQPVFPMPLSFGLTETGFAFGLPTISATEKNIAGGFKPDVTVDTGAKSAQVSGYDTATVTVAGLDDAGKVVGHTTIAQGSPFVSYTAATKTEVKTGSVPAKTGDFWTVESGDVAYGLVVNDGKVSGSSVELDEGGTVTFFVIPSDGSAEQLATLAANPVTGSSLAYEVDGDKVQTTITYQSKGDTAFASLPHQQEEGSTAGCDLGTYPSIYGTMKLCSGTELSWSAPLSNPTSQLDLDKLSNDERSTLSAQVTKDIAALPAFPADTYFGGKALYRAAMLLQLAQQLELQAPATELKATLVGELEKWTDPKGCEKRQAFCFVYDDQGKGIVGLTPSFGSDEFNDHHFHYGYFLYAAGVASQDDPELAKKLAPVMDLLAADIGSAGQNGAFPDRRTFDAYASHSWASGTSPFADGNNQESSSEAITAWTGLALWALSSDNAALRTEATWMLSSEAEAGLAYWTNFDKSQPVYEGFGHEIVPLNWGGKRDYATWFSPEPAAMLGILVIPMSPASTYLAGDPERINANVAEATGGKFDQKFGDYLLMYSALAGEEEREAALAKAEKLDDKWIDDGNSRSYMLAWLMSSGD